jgi:hypothetical protein
MTGENLKLSEGKYSKRAVKRLDDKGIIGFTELFDKINAIIIKNGAVELQETSFKKPDYY